MGLVDDIYNEINVSGSEEIYASNVKKERRKCEEMIKMDDFVKYVYGKTYVCPVCDEEFKNKTVRTGKSRMVSSDMDLKPHYEPISSEYYDVVLCDNCGYAALAGKFEILSGFQIDLIAEEITPKYERTEFSDIFTPEDALFRYKQALKCCIVKKAKASEKAYIALRIAWIYRDLHDVMNEAQYIKIAYDGFIMAIEQEYYPLCGLDESTVLYILANLAYKLGDTDMAKKLAGNIAARKNINSRIKEKLYDFRELLKNS